MLNYNSSWKNFFSDESSASFKDPQIYEVYNMSRLNRFNITLYSKKSGSWKKIDVYGDHSQASSGSEWEINSGWSYRKNGRPASTTYNADDWNIKPDEFELIAGSATDGNDLATDKYPLFRFNGPSEFSGVDSDTLRISRLPITLHDKNFRAKITTPGYACGEVIFSECANLKVDEMEDSDGDGVPDYVDLDSDNDGIFDEIEGCDEDLDGDGIPNCLDDDSDGDDCKDVIEAGFSDPDGDGYLGPEDVKVDISGVVVSASEGEGYVNPNDLDENGVFDFLEFGDGVSVELDPSNVNVIVYDDTIFIGSGTAPGEFTRKWYQSSNGGDKYTALSNTPPLMISGVFYGDRSNAQRPKGIELSAIRDVEDIRLYSITIGDLRLILTNSNSSKSGQDLDKGEFYYGFGNISYFRDFFNNSGPSNNFNYLNYKYYQNNNFYQIDGKKEITLWKRSTVSGSDWVAIDKVKGQGDEDYSYGWKYKNDTTQIGVEYNSGDWTTCKSCLDNRNTNNIAGSFYEVDTDGDTLFYNFPIGTFKNPVLISGVDTDTLRIENIPYSMDGYLFQLEMVALGYACELPVSTKAATLKVFLPDFDNDGYAD